MQPTFAIRPWDNTDDLLNGRARSVQSSPYGDPHAERRVEGCGGRRDRLSHHDGWILVARSAHVARCYVERETRRADPVAHRRRRGHCCGGVSHPRKLKAAARRTRTASAGRALYPTLFMKGPIPVTALAIVAQRGEGG
jgi:hypothetical protein